ncbi:hypothetical protein HOC67_00070, partial [Candidatus Peregrinibacteria bacterium]|nr:hypothetical protein [Candidatus Peregrinibacteria bacterium]
KTSEEITPAKRWSFLVGINEGSHTAQSRFVPLLESNDTPNLKELEEAFNIEKVTNEFFEKYCDLFIRMKESLDVLLEKDPILKSDFESKEITTVDFAKKTLGQMAFLYFLQKKGWFGVAPSKEWGTGAKNFLRALFNARGKYGGNFFDEVLEPLFYEALAQDRGRDAIYPRLNNCRMPFLNGGLFEPMNGYSWETTHISLPDELFSNSNITKEGDIGDGILDIFDRYNFTVNENEPLEKEVAVDPEMLGKVFENLLEIRDRKSKGAFYTPREIVHYMCQECLINYLQSEIGETIPREDIELFIQKGVQIIQNDKIVLERNKKNDSTYKLLLPESIRESASKLDKLLLNIKVCDPAVGSGAFPLGMLNEIVRARQVLQVHSGRTLSTYNLKLHTISHSLYGVDIDSGAVEIAKLRMWLALVVEEKDPHPLPNLEHKIMQGNSLISEYEGIKLFDDSFLIDTGDTEKEKIEINEKLSALQREYFDLHSKNQLNPVKKMQIERDTKQLQKRLNEISKKSNTSNNINNIGIFDTPAKQQLAQEKTKILQKKIEQFVSESHKTKKQELKEEIDSLKWDLIESTLEEQGRMDKLEEIRELRRKNIRPFFIWKLEFSEIFKYKGGFDVVIGNPPYVDSEEMVKNMPELREQCKKIYSSAVGNWDLFVIFIEKAMSLCHENGIHSFIVPNKLIGEQYSETIRSIMKRETTLLTIRDYSNVNVFVTADVYPCTYVLTKKSIDQDILFELMADESRPKYSTRVIKDLFIKDVLWDKYFFPTSIVNIINKISINKSLSEQQIEVENAATVNEAYEVKKLICDKKNNSNTFKLINTGTIDRYCSKWLLQEARYIKDRYSSPYVDLTKLGEKRIKQSKASKLIIAGMTKELEVFYDTNGEFYAAKSTLTLSSNKWDLGYLCALLNSKLVTFWYQITFNSLSLAGGYLKINKNCFSQIPFKAISPEKQKLFIELVDQILVITTGKDYDPKKPPIRQKVLEAKIDEMTFDLYELTPEERQIILDSTK